MAATADLLSEQDRQRLEELGLIEPKAEQEPPGETAGQDRDNGYRRKHGSRTFRGMAFPHETIRVIRENMSLALVSRQ
jgi:hypothetical protein